MKKVVFTLNVNDYEPEIRKLTYPLMQEFARKIKAEFVEITGRAFPTYPVTCEKWQIFDLGRGFDWIYYFDADTLIHPECIDFTCWLDKDTCAHNGQDFAALRFHYDEFFARDKRNIGTCGWLTIAPQACIAIWEPPEFDAEELISRCFPMIAEWSCGLIDKGHLADDYVMSRNIARWGFKHDTLMELLPRIGLGGSDFFWHAYTISGREKLRQMRETLWRWRIPKHMVDTRPTAAEMIRWKLRRRKVLRAMRRRGNGAQ